MEKVELATFRYTAYAQEILFGSGILSELGAVVKRYGWKRLMLCTSRSMRVGGQAAKVIAAMGDRLHLVYDQVQPHVQDYQVEEALDLAQERRVEAVVGLGGGSPIGMAKAVAYSLAEQQMGHPLSLSSAIEQPLIPVIAIPTTYAGSEMTPLFGITRRDPAQGGLSRKVTVNHPTNTPRLVVYDIDLTLNLPPVLTASTGMNALAHAIEALYSTSRHPLSTAAAISAIHHIGHGLLASYRDAGSPGGNNLEARSEMLLGAHLAGASIANVTLGLHHGLCHVLGGSANVPHGIANSIILPHVLRFNADATAELLLPAVEALGLPTTGVDPTGVVVWLASAIADLSAQMNLPSRLRDAGVKETDLDRLAQLAFQNQTVQNNPKPIRDAGQLLTLLQETW